MDVTFIGEEVGGGGRLHKRLCVILRNAYTCFEYLTEAVLCMLASLLYCEAQHEPGRALKAAGRTWPRPPRSGTFLGSCESRLRNVQGGREGGRPAMALAFATSLSK